MIRFHTKGGMQFILYTLCMFTEKRAFVLSSVRRICRHWCKRGDVWRINEVKTCVDPQLIATSRDLLTYEVNALLYYGIIQCIQWSVGATEVDALFHYGNGSMMCWLTESMHCSITVNNAWSDFTAYIVSSGLWLTESIHCPVTVINAWSDMLAYEVNEFLYYGKQCISDLLAYRVHALFHHGRLINASSDLIVSRRIETIFIMTVCRS